MEDIRAKEIASELIKKIGALTADEGHSFIVSTKFEGHEYTAKYFKGTYENDGFYDILPGLIVTTDGIWECTELESEVYSLVSKSKEYQELQEKYNKWWKKAWAENCE